MPNKRLTISIPYDEFGDLDRAFQRLEKEGDRYTSYASEVFLSPNALLTRSCFSFEVG